MCLLKCSIFWRILDLLLIFSIMPVVGYSQWVDPEDGVVVEPTAAMSKFVRYGNTPVSLYTGSIDVSIPIYTYEDYEFNIPISLKYVFSGQKTNDPTGSVGLGWVLNAGGCITRQINNLPDEAMMKGDNSVYGFYDMYRYGWSVPNIQSSTYQLWDTSGYFYPMGRENVEAEPDIFSFNFMGHSGKFMFWGNNQIVVFETSSPKGNYIIEPTVAYERITGITIKTKDGYTYKFDGSENLNTANDISSYDYKAGTWLEKYNEPQVMWPLVSVSAPSGRTLTLEYEKPDEYVDNARPMSYLIEDKINPENPDRELKWAHFACLNEQKQKSLYLRKITLSDIFSIDFNYSAMRIRESCYDRYRNLKKMITERLLKSVIVNNLSTHTSLKTINFDYNEGRPNPVAFLSEVRISDIGSYDFNYWNEAEDNQTPYKGTFGVDHWGYNNGRVQNRCDDYFPRTSLVDNKETVTTAQRDPDFKHSLCGALRSIVYPSHGKTEFIYEPNDYSAAVIKSGLNSGKPYLDFYRRNMIAGGIRIKQIIDYDYNFQGGVWEDTLRIRTYSYVDLFGKSSGILLRSPRYRTSQIQSTTTPDPYPVEQRFIAAADILECIDTDHHIEYTSVTETYRDGSYCRYNYTNYNDHDDRLVFDYRSPTTDWAPGGIVVNDPQPFFYMRPGSRKASRGKLQSKILCCAKSTPDSADVPSYMEVYDYNTILNGYWRIRLTRYYWYQQDVITESCLMNSCRKYNYFDDGKCLAMTTEYHYDYRTDYITGLKIYDKSGKCTKQNIAYASGSYVADSPFPANIHTQVLMPGEREYKTSEIKKYEYFGIKVTPTLEIPRLTNVWTTCLDKPKTYPSDTNQENDLILERTLVPSVSRFNQIADRAGNVTSYLYGGNGCNLLAVVQNVAYYDVLSILGNPYYLDDYRLTIAQEAALRNIPKAMVTTYSYLPLIGLASVTDPSGNTQTYSYDDCRRLSEIYSNDHIEKEFKYQIYN